MRFNLPHLIGITGRAGAGKDTLADYLVHQFNYAKRGLADPIKALLNERFGWSDAQWLDREWKETPLVTSLLEDGPVLSPRQLAQWLGTEVGRNIGGPDVWVNLMEREWKRNTFTCGPRNGYQPHMVVPDVRFDNEARRIHTLGGVILRVVRPNQTPVQQHVSEAGVSNELVNVEVQNDSDLVTFLRNCVYALEQTPRGR